MELDHSAKLGLLDPPLGDGVFTLETAAEMVVAE